jgi:hypothetical protein
MKAIVLCFKDVNPGSGANDIVLLAEVVYCGADVPGQVRSDQGPDGSGRVAIPLALNGMTQASYSNAIEDALIARAAAHGDLPVLARTDVLLPTYTRGS